MEQVCPPELGNGDKFIFDVGTGSNERIAAFQIPHNFLDKVFLSHLHTDHFGDLDALFVGGALAGRQKPLRVWGQVVKHQREVQSMRSIT